MIRSGSTKEKYRFSRLIKQGKQHVLPADLFPLPVQTDKSLCRDAFLRQVLGSDNYTETLEDLSSTNRRSTTFINVGDSNQNLSDVKPLFRPSNARRSQSTVLSTDSKVLAMDLNEMMLMRYRYLLSDIGNQSIRFLIEYLKSQLTIIGDVCCGKLDPMYKVFSWSITDHLAMFETRRNTVYLDILERMQTERELDKMKLKVDINEIIRLLDAIQDDFAARRQYVKLKRLDCDYLHPIEVRYSINLANDAVERANFVDSLAQEAITDELAKIELLTEQDVYVWQSCQLSYAQTIEEYKSRIEQLQTTYDEDMDRTENELQEMRNTLQKCKDDLLYYQEEVQFFQSEVKRTQDIIAQEQLKPKKSKGKVKMSKT
ncbi:uncharacterized protein Dwil_GK14680 [Drosophila willistoni]|uniref:Uncharacterized protein n=1 Tax=Drosophila willistoni TaxID=7260 RepID=B4MV54_DROWI|nr:uncharacterized protein Dwil_GK14680 [Drosophila willistoni]